MLTQQAPYTLNQLSNSTFTLIGFYGVCLHYQTKKPGFRAITSCELKLQNQNCNIKKKELVDSHTLSVLCLAWPPGGSRILAPTSVPTRALQRGPKLQPSCSPEPSCYLPLSSG